ncbi:MAG TPA: pyridoxamine 5'-phosphate oxidase family protein [Candidatus Baltobacteraceae bacterium]|nr:pyridoxamine 5'-phosphate oxidase family protein [Candidatus Baltobacteraceae bacterium]
MNTSDVLSFLHRHRWAVVATVSANGAPEGALVGIATTGDMEIVFDTTDDTRKFANLKSNAKIALVVGGWVAGDERTLQCEGCADLPEGDELERLKEVYFGVFPEGRERQAWPGITYVRVRPTWLRYSDFTVAPPIISEATFGPN